MLNKKPAERLTWPALLDHPFVRDGPGVAREGRLAEGVVAAEKTSRATKPRTPPPVDDKARDRDVKARDRNTARRSPSPASPSRGPLEGTPRQGIAAAEAQAASADGATALRATPDLFLKVLDTVKPQTKTSRDLLTPRSGGVGSGSSGSDDGGGAGGANGGGATQADVAAALRTVQAAAKGHSAGPGDLIDRGAAGVVVFAAARAALNASSPPRPELAALALRTLPFTTGPTIGAGNTSKQWAGVGLEQYLDFLTRVLCAYKSDARGHVPAAAAGAIAAALESFVATGDGGGAAAAARVARDGGLVRELARALAAADAESAGGGSDVSPVAGECARAVAAVLSLAPAASAGSGSNSEDADAEAAAAFASRGGATRALSRVISSKRGGSAAIRGAIVVLARVVAANADVSSTALACGSIAALRDVLLDDACGVTLAAAALKALTPLVAAAAAGGFGADPAPPAKTLVDEKLVIAAAAALDPARPNGGNGVSGREREDIVVDASRLLRLPFEHPIPVAPGAPAANTDASLQRYQECLLSESVVVSLVQAVVGLRGDALIAPVGLLSQLVLRSPSYAQQFLEAGGLDPSLTKTLLDPRNDASVLVDALLAISQLARISARHYAAIARADVLSPVERLLSHADAGVRARGCNLLGNVCRHNDYFYENFRAVGALDALIDRCADPDRTTRKFACFAIGNAGFHSDALYDKLADAISPLVDLLSDEEDKTRANAAAALGNLVRNSAALCRDLVEARALEALIELACSPRAIREATGGRRRGGATAAAAGGGGGGETASHTTPFAWCTPFLKDFSRRHSSPALPFQRLTGKTFD